MENTTKDPLYLNLHQSGELDKRIETGNRMLQQCNVCPRACRVDRSMEELGSCQIGSKALVASYGPHFGEESSLVGRGGSGAIFFSGCNLHCVFCQNSDISHFGDTCQYMGDVVSAKELAEIMIGLQKQGCHNINLVTPSHVIPQIISALPSAIEMGLRVPIVYNSSGYDSVHSLKLLQGIIDIYMPDCKFWNPDIVALYTEVKDYPEIMIKAVKEMFGQVGNLEIDTLGLCQRGLLVRHLVMPGLLQQTKDIVCFIASEISRETYINIMDQYRPCFRADEYDEINRVLAREEYEQAVVFAKEAGLYRLEEKNWFELVQNLYKK